MSHANKTSHINLVTIIMMVDEHTHRLRVSPLNCYVHLGNNFILIWTGQIIEEKNEFYINRSKTKSPVEIQLIGNHEMVVSMYKI